KVGTRVPPRLKAAKTLRAPYAVVVPGLVNTHHHLFQTLTRACTAAANAELFDWLMTLYPRWARIDEEAVNTAALVGMAELMRQTASLARRHGVRLHTHLAETRDEEEYCRKQFRKRPLDFFRDCGWLHEDTWVAHGIYFNSSECSRLGRARVGVAHCPTSN